MKLIALLSIALVLAACSTTPEKPTTPVNEIPVITINGEEQIVTPARMDGDDYLLESASDDFGAIDEALMSLS